MKLTDIARAVEKKIGKLNPEQIFALLGFLDEIITDPRRKIRHAMTDEEFDRAHPGYGNPTTVTFMGNLPAQIYINPSQGSNRRSGESPKGAIKSFRELSTRLEGQGRTLTDGEILETIAELVLKLRSKGSKLRLVEERIVDHANSQTKGNKSAGARLLGIERKAFERRVTK